MRSRQPLLMQYQEAPGCHHVPPDSRPGALARAANALGLFCGSPVSYATPLQHNGCNAARSMTLRTMESMFAAVNSGEAARGSFRE